MKLVNFKSCKEILLGIKVENGVIDVKKAGSKFCLDVPETMEQLIKEGEPAISKLKELIKMENEFVIEEDIIYAPPVTNPEKILCVGLNYMSHGKECKMDIPSSPVLFSKFSNALAAHNEEVYLPKSAYKYDYEAELVIVIGKEAFNVSEEDALNYVFGYTAGNDLSARDLQFVSGQWLLGKTCDGFAPIGPCIVTSDEIDPYNLDIKCEVNGEIRQNSNTRDMIFNCASIISYASKYMTLKPGDIIFSGTPSGVMLGYPEDEKNWLKPNDKVTVYLEKIGSLVTVLR
ncbi:MAG: fumarylacetoacetate hydrolase family protein [Solirubrobacterales bacterium]